MPTESPLPNLHARLTTLYGPRAGEVAKAVESLVNNFHETTAQPPVDDQPRWTERDVVLITYADQLHSDGATPLETLRTWLTVEGLDKLLSIVHLLPFCPYSSDDGFSVIDYLSVDPQAGTWDDIDRLGENVDLMFDLVLNHISQHSDWYQKYLAGEQPYDRFFVEVDPAVDLSAVVRPRSLPLLTEAATSRGTRHVWTTFSEDQIDLNYAEPEVLVRMLEILLEYAKRGARIIRLDAVAFLWKEAGTNCLHLPETHEAVKLMREVVAALYPHTLLLTETNVPHQENVSYFGSGDEAHMVYQFSLPPLLLDAFTNGDAVYLRQWLDNLAPPPPGCTFFNFTASHDGVGVRPLEGLVPDERFNRVVEAVRARGGLVNTRRRPDGTDVPYELNITYVDALSPTARNEAEDINLHARRFLSSQALMLALPGIPAVYFHSLAGTQNDYTGVEQSGINRRINRHKYQLPELKQHLAPRQSLASLIFSGYQSLLTARKSHPAFHPDASIRLLDVQNPSILGFERTSLDGKDSVLVLVNFGGDATIDLQSIAPVTNASYQDLLGSNAAPLAAGEFAMPAGGSAWLEAQ